MKKKDLSVQKKPRQELSLQQLSAVSGGSYSGGRYTQEASAFLRERVGEDTYAMMMSDPHSRSHPYVPARIFLDQADWDRFVWIEQHGSLDGFSG